MLRKLGVIKEISRGEARVGDIETYDPTGKRIDHAGVIHSNEKGNVILRSKWGPMGVFEHGEKQVPENYLKGGVRTYTKAGHPVISGSVTNNKFWRVTKP